jgi:hypothetical protein
MTKAYLHTSIVRLFSTLNTMDRCAPNSVWIFKSNLIFIIFASTCGNAFKWFNPAFYYGTILWNYRTELITANSQYFVRTCIRYIT